MDRNGAAPESDAASPIEGALAELVSPGRSTVPAAVGTEGSWWPRGVDREPPTVDVIDDYLRESGARWWSMNRPGWTEPGWWEAAMLPSVRDLIRLPKGPELLAAVQQVPAPDGSRCEFPHPHHGEAMDGLAPGEPGNPCACQIIALAAWATAASWATDRADQAALHALGPTEHRPYLDPRRPGLGTISDPAVETVAPALRRSCDSMRHYVAKLRDRVHQPESLRRAIHDGLLPAWQGDLIMQDLITVDPEGHDLVLDTVIDTLRQRHARGMDTWTFADIRRRTKTVIATLDEELRRQRDRVHAGRRVAIQRGGDGWSRITADLPSDVAERIFARVTALAAGLDDDGSEPEPRTLDQKRADVLSDLVLTPSSGESGSAGEVSIIIPASTLLGADDRAATMSGCGPIPADVARALAADRKWRAWITNAAGTVVATSPTTSTPTAAVARVVRAREPECRMPGCRRARVDLDHVIPWPRGQTVPGNLGSLCRRHHNLKTHGSWQLSDEPDGTYRWTDPQGITHRDECQPPLPW